MYFGVFYQIYKGQCVVVESHRVRRAAAAISLNDGIFVGAAEHLLVFGFRVPSYRSKKTCAIRRA